MSNYSNAITITGYCAADIDNEEVLKLVSEVKSSMSRINNESNPKEIIALNIINLVGLRQYITQKISSGCPIQATPPEKICLLGECSESTP